MVLTYDRALQNTVIDAQDRVGFGGWVEERRFARHARRTEPASDLEFAVGAQVAKLGHDLVMTIYQTINLLLGQDINPRAGLAFPKKPDLPVRAGFDKTGAFFLTSEFPE